MTAGAARGAATDSARLESMQIGIWPEYDRAAALVIFRAELAAEVAIPANVSLRLPASSGGPAAVAYSTEKKGGLLNLKYERSDAADFITLRFSAPSRFFQIEFYDRLATGDSARSYKYVWPGDLAVNWLDVVVQEPAGASNVSVRPELAEKVAGSDGLQYRSAQLGPHKKGAPLPIEIRYTKTDARTSAEILKLGTAAPAPQAALAPVEKNASWLSPTVLGAAALLAFTTSLVAFLLWWRLRSQDSAGTGAGGAFCTGCGHRLSGSDRFCSKCGAARA